MAVAEKRCAPGYGDVLTAGFGSTVAMWLAGYLGRLPPGHAPAWSLGLVMLACFVAGGFWAGKYGTRGWQGGVAAGALSAGLNLLVLGSLLADPGAGGLRPGAVLWVPGSLAVGAILGGLGGVIGARGSVISAASVQYTGAFVRVTAVATLLLLLAGGLVTSAGAGLAVVDWPNSFGHNMFLYPLSRMTGGIYYEHAHRLFGSLVGLCTVVMAAHLAAVERRRWVRQLGLAAVPVVVIQGVLGGLRVTGRFTFSTEAGEMAPQIGLAVVHGVLGQAFFAVIVALAAFTSARWQSGPPPRVTASAGVDRGLSSALVGALFLQLLLGAVQRHLAVGLLVHITLAVVVIIIVVVAGVRVVTVHGSEPVLRRLGRAGLWLVSIQVALGIGALAALASRAEGVAAPAWDVLVRTAHQGTGAVLLAVAALLAVWSRRLVMPVR